MPNELSITAYVVLGLVSIRPAGGHELAAFADRSIGTFFPLTRSHVFSELARLHVAGLVEATEVVQKRFPTKRVYEITEEGEAVLRQWLEESTVGPDRQRNSFLVRIFFGDMMSPGRIETLLEEFEAAATDRRDRLAEIVEHLANRPQVAFRRATAMFGVRREQAKLDWAAEVRPLLLEAASSRAPQR